LFFELVDGVPDRRKNIWPVEVKAYLPNAMTENEIFSVHPGFKLSDKNKKKLCALQMNI